MSCSHLARFLFGQWTAGSVCAEPETSDWLRLCWRAACHPTAPRSRGNSSRRGLGRTGCQRTPCVGTARGPDSPCRLRAAAAHARRPEADGLARSHKGGAGPESPAIGAAAWCRGRGVSCHVKRVPTACQHPSPWFPSPLPRAGSSPSRVVPEAGHPRLVRCPRGEEAGSAAGRAWRCVTRVALLVASLPAARGLRVPWACAPHTFSVLTGLEGPSYHTRHPFVSLLHGPLASPLSTLQHWPPAHPFSRSPCTPTTSPPSRPPGGGCASAVGTALSCKLQTHSCAQRPAGCSRPASTSSRALTWEATCHPSPSSQGFLSVVRTSVP